MGQASTLQSASIDNNVLQASNILPPNPRTQQPLDSFYQTGDDTVPMLSAIPVHLSNNPQDLPFVESHGALQSNIQVWNFIQNYLQRLQGGIEDFRYPESPIRPVEQIPAGISLSVDDLYLYNEQFTLIPEIINVDSEILQRTNNFGGLSAIITPVNTNAEQEELELDLQQQQDKQYQLTIQPNKLQPGLYRLKVETNIAHTDAPNPVHDLFVISE